jgi:hypothetical protein
MISIFRNNTTHIMMPGGIGYIQSISDIKAREDGLCYFFCTEITAGKDTIVSKLDSKTRYYHVVQVGS